MKKGNIDHWEPELSEAEGEDEEERNSSEFSRVGRREPHVAIITCLFLILKLWSMEVELGNHQCGALPARTPPTSYRFASRDFALAPLG
jgi:hypothetical protein